MALTSTSISGFPPSSAIHPKSPQKAMLRYHVFAVSNALLFKWNIRCVEINHKRCSVTEPDVSRHCTST